MGNLYLSAPSEFSPTFSSRLSRPRDAEIRANFHKMKKKIVSPSARLLTDNAGAASAAVAAVEADGDDAGRQFAERPKHPSDSHAHGP